MKMVTKMHVVTVPDSIGSDVMNFTILLSANNSATNGTDTNYDQSQFDAFIYIVVVLLFYASALVILMIKYMKGERSEARLTYYFEEFVKRETFYNRVHRDSVQRTKSTIMNGNCV